MTGQVLRRLLLAVPLVLAVSFLTFLLSRLAGGSWFDRFKTDRRFDPARIRALEREAHLDQPLPLQWLHWLRGVCFDVRLGRPSLTLIGFEQPLVVGRDYTATPGLGIAAADEVSGADDERMVPHEGALALRIDVPEGGGALQLALPPAARDSRCELRIWRRDAAASERGFQPQTVRASDGIVTLSFGQPGRAWIDALECVEPQPALTFGRPDFGRSFQYDLPVFDLLLPALASSAWLAFSTLTVTWLLAVPLGTWSATRRGGLVDRALSFLSFAGASVPGFFLALLALCACVAWANGVGGRPLLPLGGDRSPGYEALGLFAKLLDRARHLVLPVAVLTLGALAGAQRTLRASLIETLHAPFVESARARGLPERRVVRRHALRSALHPLVTIFGIRLAELLSGAALVEVVFQYPGMGRLVLDATIGRDLFVVTGAVLLGALLLVAANLLADLALAWLDPRTHPAGAPT